LNKVEYKRRKLCLKRLSDASIPSFPFLFYPNGSDIPRYLRRFNLTFQLQK
jgi:hypothetical protein